MTNMMNKLELLFNSLMLWLAGMTRNSMARQKLSERRVLLYIRMKIAKERTGSQPLFTYFL